LTKNVSAGAGSVFPVFRNLININYRSIYVWAVHNYTKFVSFKTQLRLDNRFCRLVSNYQLNAQFLYSITIYMLYYNPRQVSSSTMLIFRRTNCIITASGIITLEISERSYINKMKSVVLLKK